MKAPNEYWGDLVAGYLGEVERARARVNHPRSREVLDDLRAHLEQRYAELEPEERTPERLRELIGRMEEPEEYAELLAPGGRRAGPHDDPNALSVGPAARQTAFSTETTDCSEQLRLPTDPPRWSDRPYGATTASGGAWTRQRPQQPQHCRAGPVWRVRG